MRFPMLRAAALSLVTLCTHAQKPPAPDTGCPPNTSCVTPAAPAPVSGTPATPPPKSTLPAAAEIVDNVTTGTFLVPQAVAQAVGDRTAVGALNGPLVNGIGYATKGLSAAASTYQGYRTDGVSGAVTAGAQAATEAAVEEGIVHGSAAVGGALFGPPGAEVGELVGKGSAFVGSLIRKLPCGNTDVQGCVTDIEFDVYDRWRHSQQCDENGVCYDPNSGQTNMLAPDEPFDSTSSARARMEGDFNQTQTDNAVAAANQTAMASIDANASGGDSSQGLLDILALTSTLQQSLQQPLPQQATPRTPLRPAPSAAPVASPPSYGPPAGWVPCSCPSQHAGSGRYFGGQLYHPEGPKCR
jgi:hypothetical protein